MIKVEELFASMIAPNAYVNRLKGVFINGQWFSCKATVKVVFEIPAFMGSGKKISKGQIK